MGKDIYSIDYSGYIVDRNTLKRVMCVIGVIGGRGKCGKYARYMNGGCVAHGACSSCSGPVAVPTEKSPRYCSACVCSRCKSLEGLGWVNAFNELGRLEKKLACGKCRPIIERENAHKLCRRCKARPANIWLRGSKRPSLCADDAQAMTADQRNTHYCAFCPEKASTYRSIGAHSLDGRLVDMMYVCCKGCQRELSCFKDGCTPKKKCKKCSASINRETDVNEAELARLGLRAASRYPNPGWSGANNHYSADSKVPCPTAYCNSCAFIAARVMVDRKPGALLFEPADKREDRRTNKSRRFLGAEIEVCGLRDFRAFPDFHRFIWEKGGAIVHDGSLPVGGIEINSWPAAGDHFIRMVENICAQLAKCGAWVNDTFEPYERQAGLHIHVDAQDHTYADMRKLLLMYSVIEPALLRMQPYSRIMLGQDNGHGQNRRYSIPCGDRYRNGIINLGAPKNKEKYTGNLKKELINSLYDGRLKAPARTQRHVRQAPDVHYYALNIQSWFYRGTIESRMHTGTVNAKEIIGWGMLWASIVDTTYRMTEVDVREFEKAKSLETLLSLAPTQEIRDYINSRTKRFAAEWKKA